MAELVERPTHVPSVGPGPALHVEEKGPGPSELPETVPDSSRGRSVWPGFASAWRLS